MDVALDIINYFKDFPWVAVLILFSCNLVFIPVMEEFSLLVGGFLAAQLPDGSGWGVALTMFCCWFGMVFTDYWDYLLARWFGKPLMNSKLGRLLVPPDKLSKAMEKVDKYGARIVFGVRFVPGGIRVPTFMACGLSSVTHRAFLLNSGVGALIVMQISFWIGYSLGDNIEQLRGIANRMDTAGKIVIGVVALVIICAVFIVKKRKKSDSADQN